MLSLSAHHSVTLQALSCSLLSSLAVPSSSHLDTPFQVPTHALRPSHNNDTLGREISSGFQRCEMSQTSHGLLCHSLTRTTPDPGPLPRPPLPLTLIPQSYVSDPGINSSLQGDIASHTQLDMWTPSQPQNAADVPGLP